MRLVLDVEVVREGKEVEVEAVEHTFSQVSPYKPE